MHTSLNLTPVTVMMTRLAARYRWLHAPAGLLLVMLQRTPVIRVAAMAEYATATGAGEGMKYLFTAAALGAYNSLAGATSFSVSPATPASGAANSTFTISGTVGTPMSISYTVTGAPGNPRSWSVTGTLPAGLTVTGGNPVDVTSPYKMSITGTPSAGGSSTVTVTAWDTAGAKGNKASITSVFNITGAAATAPAITAQPASITVTAGAGATFSVTATGSPAPTYQWQKGGANIAGATSASYALASAQAADAGSYAVVVTNSAGSVTSTAATLTVNAAAAAPAFTAQPAGTTITAGSSFTLTATASGSPAPTYQWQKGGVNIAGATSASYTVASALTADSGSYTVVATNSAGSATSTAATVTVNATATAPAFTAQPASTTITAGSSFTLTATASGSPAPTYQWQKGGVNIAGATSASYTVASALTGDSGSYTVVATNSAGSATSTAATVTVNAATSAPAITTQPQALSVIPNSSATFTVTATGAPAPTYQWRKDGANIAGATSASYSIASAQATDAGSYTVVVSNSVGSVTSAGAALTVSAIVTAPAITTQPLAQSATAGTSVTFTVAASGTAPFTYQWRKDGANIAGATSASYSIASAQTTNAGSYTVVVTNSAGSVTSAGAALTVSAAATAPAITTQPLGQSVTAGASVTFTVAASGTAPFTYQWRKDGANIAGATSASYSIASAQTTDVASYSVTVTNSAGQAVSTNAALTVSAAAATPVISGNPLSQTVATGRSVSFSVNAAGATSYQWQVSSDGGATWAPLANNGTYSGATSAQLTITGAGAGMNGYLYRAVASSAGGSINSSPVTLTVAPPVLPGPTSVSFDRSGRILASDSSSNVLVTVDASGQVAELAGLAGTQGADDGSGGSARFRAPGGMALNAAGDTYYLADTGNSLIRVITSGGMVTTLAGSTSSQGYRDGTGTAAWFNAPADAVVDRNGNVFVADTGNSAIRRIAPDGTVTTFAGSAGLRGSADGSGATARFNQPGGITMDASGVLYVADTFNHTIRRITAAGAVSTFAGVPGISGIDDGAGALFNQPGGLAFDSSGNLYVADTGNNTIRVITPAGLVRTVAGLPGVAGLEDGSGLGALFNQPKDVSLDNAGFIWVADYGNATLRKVSAAGVVSTPGLSAAPAPVSTPTPTPSTPTSGGNSPSSSPPAEVGVGGGGGAVSPWFLLSLAGLGALRRFGRRAANAPR